MNKNARESLKEKAEKLLKGFKLCLMNQTEINVGTTPYEPFFTENKFRLHNYIPEAENFLFSLL